MNLWLILSMILISFMSLLLCSSPLAMGLTILSIALLIAILYSLTCSSWFGLLIFLIYIGGMLVMFSYFVALIPNQPLISISNLNILSISMIITLLLTNLFNTPPMMISIHSNFTEVMYQSQNTSMLILLALILLLTMVITVKITHRSSGPLRAFMSYV